MSGYRLPAPHGARIDRGAVRRFSFNGRETSGFAGDTIASALLAHGVRQVGRSLKLHRPRGIFSCGVEEPTGLLEIGRDAARTPDTRATDMAVQDGLVARSANAWPGLRLDVAAVNNALAAFLPAGFYYKTFMWPHWHLFEPVIRRMAGLGRAGDGADPARYAEASLQAEVLVIGAGLAGMQAALAACRAGRQVVLLEADLAPGGWHASQNLRGGDATTWQELARAVTAAGIAVQYATTAVALYDHGLVVAAETCAGGEIRERLWKIRAGRIILATGAFERPMLFPDNDRPGVMLAGAVERYAALYGVACGRRAVIAAGCDAAYGVAQSLVATGIAVAAIVDHRAAAALGPGARAPAGVPVLHDAAIIGLRGARGVASVRVAGHDGRGVQDIDADLVASAGGPVPNVALHAQAGGTLRWHAEAAMFVPDRSAQGVVSVGACAGVFDDAAALAHAAAVGRDAAAPRVAPVGGCGLVAADNRPGAAALAALHARPGKIFVDLQNDVTSADVALAARENYRSVEHLKRYTTTGMATDQGKTSNVNALILLGAATGRAPEAVGTTRFRPPFRPVTLNAIVGGRLGARQRPLKQLAARGFHAARGALFEDFGGWERPAAYPLAGETLIEAAERETVAVRQAVGLFDASPLGKIEVCGPDAAAFLDLMYVGTLSTLPVGGARYGALLNENGIVVDDGIVARLGPEHFWVNTTSGGAERAAFAFEEWLQCEYVGMRVLVAPVTAQWGNVTVSGPLAWRLLDSIGAEPALSPAQMPHMTMRESMLAGIRLRVLRASFNGELSYELNLAAGQTEGLLQRLWDAGAALGISAYGVEALMIMRTEKAYLHVGADTDGTTQPGDVGLARGIARKAANFVGRRSLTRPAGTDPDRLQLVGVQPLDRQARLPVGAHLSVRPPPASAEGFVTSSCYSPSLQQTVALALVRRGRRRQGERLTAWHLGNAVGVEIVQTPFYDPTGARLLG